MSQKALPTIYQQYIHVSRYARYQDDLGRRETWEETVERYINFFKGRIKSKKIPWDDLKNAILDIEVMPSMRCMMTAGPALEESQVAGYNCSYLPIDNQKAFDEILYILCCGTGVGFSVETKYVNKLPEIPDELHPSDTTIIFKDSKIGWASGYREFISLLYSGKIPKWDVSKIRPAGTRLKTFGGRASGPEPLVDLLYFTIDIFNKARGRKLTSLECHDIVCKVADVVVSGGVRRSALISLSDLNDDYMRLAKYGKWWENSGQRAIANNSAVYERKPDMGVFFKEWLSLFESKSGERGIFSRQASRTQAGQNGRRDIEQEFGCNPCSEIILRPYQFCVSGSTPLITKNGIFNIMELKDKNVDIWNGQEWTNVIVRKTGSNQKLMRVTLSDGSYLDCTPDHRWSVKHRFQNTWNEVKTIDLIGYSKYSIQVEPANVKNSDKNIGIDILNPYTLGFAYGDGCVYKDKVIIDAYGEKDWKCPIKGTYGKIYKKKNYNVESIRINSTKFIDVDLLKGLKNNNISFMEISKWNKSSVLNFVAGLADADGCITSSGGIRIYISDEFKARTLQLILTKNGLRSSVNLLHKKGTQTNLGVRKQDLWYLQITDCRELPCHRLNTSRGHVAKYKGKYQNIISVEVLDGVFDTYCFNEPKRHKGLFGNVLTYQCNLTEVIVRENDDLTSLKKKVRLATILGTLQATLTEFKYINKRWKQNTEEERLLGVSLTGIMDNKVLSGQTKQAELVEWLTKMKEEAVSVNKEFSVLLDIPQSTAITCVKPSGTVSQLTDAASGIHPRYAQYYIRRVRADKKDPLASFMIAKGYEAEEDFYAKNNWVFSFPQKAPKNSVTRNDMTAIEQLEHWKIYQDNWTEHKPSITVYVGDDEWLEVGAWIYKNISVVSGVSFLPRDNGTYRQAPYEEISKEQYEEMYKKHEALNNSIDWKEFKEEMDNTTGTRELACVAGVCEL